jgi:hypothetical protein
MKKLFDPTQAYFDDWRRVHSVHGMFVAFETGEIVMPFPGAGPLGPDDRGRLNAQTNTALDASADPIRGVTYHTPDGEPIKKSWLHINGIRYFLQDWCTMTAVRINPRGVAGRDKHPETAALWSAVPRHLRERVAVYWPDAGERPIGVPVGVRTPRKLTADERAHLTETIAACKAWYDLSVNNDTKRRLDIYQLEANRLGHGSNYYARREAEKGICASLLLKTTFNDMCDYDRVRAAIKVTAATDQRMFTHLKMVKKED